MSCATLSVVDEKVPAITGIALTYPQVLDWDDWWIPEGTVPEARYHDKAANHLFELLSEFIGRTRRSAAVARNLAIRYLKTRPRIGIDPDLCVLDPIPPDEPTLPSLCLWKPGHQRPPLCIEIVSQTHPNKDYASLHERYALMHAAEVVVFDPLRAGPKFLGGPVSLQLWRRNGVGLFERTAFGEEPAYCEYLDAWFIPRDQLLDIADDRAGQHRWQTSTERERAEKERERAEKEHERAEKERERATRIELERRLAELTQR
jgi:hypothetical protein